MTAGEIMPTNLKDWLPIIILGSAIIAGYAVLKSDFGRHEKLAMHAGTAIEVRAMERINSAQDSELALLQTQLKATTERVDQVQKEQNDRTKSVADIRVINVELEHVRAAIERNSKMAEANAAMLRELLKRSGGD